MSLRIAKYIHNQLNEKERLEFEAELKNNAKLKAEYDGFITKVNLDDREFTEKIKSVQKDNSNTFFFRFLTMAASLVV